MDICISLISAGQITYWTVDEVQIREAMRRRSKIRDRMVLPILLKRHAITTLEVNSEVAPIHRIEASGEYKQIKRVFTSILQLNAFRAEAGNWALSNIDGEDVVLIEAGVVSVVSQWSSGEPARLRLG